jgi:TetR/AcrR family transcriptional repressor of nem operon
MKFGRPLEYDPDQALNAAMHVFWQHGYEATSLQALLQAMGLSKSSLYQGFGGKKELFLRCVDRYGEGISDTMQSLRDNTGSGLEFIEQLLLASASEARRSGARRGCLLMNTATEFAQKDPEIASRVSFAFGSLRRHLKAAVEHGQSRGEITREKDAEVLASYLLSSLGGIKTMVKGGVDEAGIKEIVSVIVRALK